MSDKYCADSDKLNQYHSSCLQPKTDRKRHSLPGLNFMKTARISDYLFT